MNKNKWLWPSIAAAAFILGIFFGIVVLSGPYYFISGGGGGAVYRCNKVTGSVSTYVINRGWSYRDKSGKIKYR